MIRIVWSVAASFSLLFGSAALPVIGQQVPANPAPTPAFTASASTPNDSLRSPEVDSNGYITFRLYVGDARSVVLHAQSFKSYWVAFGRIDIANANTAATVELVKKYGSPVTHESEGFPAWNNWRDFLYLFAPQLFH